MENLLLNINTIMWQYWLTTQPSSSLEKHKSSTISKCMSTSVYEVCRHVQCPTPAEFLKADWNHNLRDTIRDSPVSVIS